MQSQKMEESSRHGKCTGHSSYITHLDWSPDNKYIMSNSGDYEILYWDIEHSCKLMRNWSECKDINWTAYTCVLGFQVFGVWPEGSDGTDINALVRSHNRKVIAVADDFFKSPSVSVSLLQSQELPVTSTVPTTLMSPVSFTPVTVTTVSTGGKT